MTTSKKKHTLLLIDDKHANLISLKSILNAFKRFTTTLEYKHTKKPYFIDK